MQEVGRSACIQHRHSDPGSSLSSLLVPVRLGLRRGLPELQAIELVVQRLQADPENLGRARLVVARVLERHQDQPPLGLLNRRARRERQRRLPAIGGVSTSAGGRCLGSMNSPRPGSSRARSRCAARARCRASDTARACASRPGSTADDRPLLRWLNSARNACTSSGRSSLRSRSGGSTMAKTFSR